MHPLFWLSPGSMSQADSNVLKSPSGRSISRIKIWVIQLRCFRTGWSFASQKQHQLVLYKDVNEIQDILVLKALHNCKLLLSETAFARCSLNSQAAWGKEALVQCGRSSCRGYNTLAKHSQAFSCPSTTIFKQQLVTTSYSTYPQLLP